VSNLSQFSTLASAKPTIIGLIAIMNPSSTSDLAFLVVSFLWTLLLIFDVRRRPSPPLALRQLGLLCHNVPAVFLFATDLAAHSIEDTSLVWFVSLIVFRYWRTLVNVWFWFQYKLAVATLN
jgi:hypothetical protein